MKYILALLGVVILCTAGTPQLDDTAAWREACKTAGYSCRGLEAPRVITASLPPPLLGLYPVGKPYILVNKSLDGPHAYAIKVHEMTHYLQWKRGAWKFTLENRCRMEKEAFDVSNAVLRRLGEYEHVVDWNGMKVLYGCEI